MDKPGLRSQITRADIHTRHNEVLGALAVAICEDLVAAKSDVCPLYLMITDSHRPCHYKNNNLVSVMASQGFSGGAFSLLFRLQVEDGEARLWKSTLRWRVGDPDCVEKMVARILETWPDHLVKMGDNAVEFLR
jgi:hypothetical protein